MRQTATGLRTLVSAVVVALLGLSLVSCDDAGSSAADTLVVGVYYDQPGWGLRAPAGGLSGFDVDLARHLATGLGYTGADVTFKLVAPAERVSDLQDGTVDMVVAALPYRAAQAQQISMAGPYFRAGQDLLVPLDDRTVTGPHSLAGRTVCTAPGTDTDTLRTLSPGVVLQQQPTATACVTALLAGRVDAVSADDAVLAGYVQEHPRLLKLLGATFSTDLFTVGLPLASNRVERVDQLIQQAYDDGTWESMFDSNLGAGGLVDVEPPVGRFTP